MKFEKLMRRSISEYEVKLGITTLMHTNNKEDAFQYWESVKVDIPDAYLTRDGIRIAYVTRSGLRVYHLV